MIFGCTGAFQNKRAVHAAVGADNKTHAHLKGRIPETKDGIRCGEGFRWMRALATGTGTGTGHVGKFRTMNRSAAQ